jgi:hypothetical protein
MKSEVLTAVAMKIALFWDVTLSSPVDPSSSYISSTLKMEAVGSSKMLLNIY